MPNFRTYKTPTLKTYQTRSRLFGRDEVLDPVYDYGQSVEFCQVQEVVAADPLTGLPVQKTLQCYPMRGFVKTDTGQQLQVN